MGTPGVPGPVTMPDPAPTGRLLGELQRGDVQWNVLLETRPHPRAPTTAPLQGRLHFVHDDGDAIRSTGWIFVASGEQEMLGRFAEFSAVELWKLLDSLA